MEGVGEETVSVAARGVRIGFGPHHLHLPGELDGTLVRFGAAVAVEDAVGEARVDELSREGGAGFRVVLVLTWQSLLACSVTAATQSGSQCPRQFTAMPAQKSRYSLPSVSHILHEAVREHRRVECGRSVDHALVLVLAHSVRVHGRGRGRDGGPDLEGAALTRDRGAGAAERRYRRAKGDGGGGVHRRRYAVGAMRE